MSVGGKMWTDRTELYHFGIMGQKWGIRRYQNSDGSLTEEGRMRYLKNARQLNKYVMSNKVNRSDLKNKRTLPAGMKIYRTTSDSKNEANGPTYVSYAKPDRDHYKGGWIKSIGKTGKAYEREYVLKEDLKIPSLEEQEKVIDKVVRNNRKYINESVKSWLNETQPGIFDETLEVTDIMGYAIEDYLMSGKSKFSKKRAEYYNGGPNLTDEDYLAVRKEYASDQINTITKRLRDIPVDEFAFTVSQSLGTAPNVKTAVISELKKSGYNAMSDIAGVGGKNNFGKEGYDPLIIFDNSVLHQVDINEVTDHDEYKSKREYWDWYSTINNPKDKKNKTREW